MRSFAGPVLFDSCRFSEQSAPHPAEHLSTCAPRPLPFAPAAYRRCVNHQRLKRRVPEITENIFRSPNNNFFAVRLGPISINCMLNILHN
jgi:hypothetical protein